MQLNFLFKNIMTSAAGNSDFASSFRGSESLLAGRAFEVTVVLAVS